MVVTNKIYNARKITIIQFDVLIIKVNLVDDLSDPESLYGIEPRYILNLKQFYRVYSKINFKMRFPDSFHLTVTIKPH